MDDGKGLPNGGVIHVEGAGSLGIGRVAPSETAIRRTFRRVDSDVLDGCVLVWIAAQRRGPADLDSASGS